MVSRRAGARAAVHSQASAAPAAADVDYTAWGLIAIVATVLITALFFAQPNVAQSAQLTPSTLGGKAVATGTPSDSLAPTVCDVRSACDGTKLIRTQADCSQFEAYCTNGCDYRAGNAVCL